MEVQISSSLDNKLLTNTTQPYLIIKLLKSFFILTKATNRQKLDKNISFQFQKQSFYSTFTRHVHLVYSGKLSQLIEHLDIMNKPALQNEWLLLYQIHDFNTQSMRHYKIGIPPYGEQIIIWPKSGRSQKSRISNSFKLHGQAFYFLSNLSIDIQEFSIITDRLNSVLYGLTYFIKDLVVCLPFHIICSEKPCPLNISLEIRYLLDRTCYIRYGSSFCTGFILNDKCVISARHLLPLQTHKKGIGVGIRIYPYNQQINGIINRIGEGSVDIIQIQVTNKLTVKNSSSDLYETDYQRDYEKLLGQQITSLGFGKYGYSPNIFLKIDQVLPTVETGIISKIIYLGYNVVFIKTDAALYNGFSGCGIWLGRQCIGMAVFILKNKNSNFNRHNFSYSLQFIQKLLKKNQKQFMISEINGLLKNFDNIQTRFKVSVMPKL